MGKMRGFQKLFLWLVPPLLLLGGCCHIFRNRDSVPYRVITQVEIHYQNGTLQSQRQLFQEENIRNIVAYLRYIDPYGTPKEDPEQATGRIYNIYVIYSDGSRRLYQQRADRYLRIDGGPWKKIDPQKALVLSGLLGMMPGDSAPASETHIPPLIQPEI